LTINAQRLQAESIQHPFFSPSNRWSFRPDPNPKSSNGEPRPGSSGKSHPLKAHSVLLFSNFISNFFSCPLLLLIGSSRQNLDSRRGPNHHLISSSPWESPTLLSSLQPNLRGSLSKQHCQNPMNGRMLSRTGPCPQLQVGETGTRGCLMMTASRQAIGTTFALLIVWNYLWLRHPKMKTF
jgi:hypothetical protein